MIKGENRGQRDKGPDRNGKDYIQQDEDVDDKKCEIGSQAERDEDIRVEHASKWFETKIF